MYLTRAFWSPPPLCLAPLQVVGVDEDVAAAQRRGLMAVQLQPLALGAGALEPELKAMGALFDAAVFYAPPSGSADPSLPPADGGKGLVDTWWRQESLAELQRVLKPGGKLCVEAPVADEAAVRVQLRQAGFVLLQWEQQQEAGVCRLLAATGLDEESNVS